MVEHGSLFDLDSWSGKTSQEHSVPTTEKISKRSSPKSSGSSKQTLPVFLYLKTANGQNPDVSWVSETTDVRFPSLGDYTTHSFGESPREENVSRLSQILVDAPHPKYCLSARACQGILNRAERRGKELPEILKNALIEQARLQSKETDQESHTGGGGFSESDIMYTMNAVEHHAVATDLYNHSVTGGCQQL